MQMRMMDQILAPRVENGEETDFGAEMLRIGGDKPQCLCSDMEENAVDGSLVLQGDGGNLFRHCKNNVESKGRSEAPTDDPESIRPAPTTGTLDSDDRRTSYTRCEDGRTDHTSQRDRRERPCGTARSL